MAAVRQCPLCLRVMDKDDPAEPAHEGDTIHQKNACRVCNAEGVPIECIFCKKRVMRILPGDISGYTIRQGDVLHSKGCRACQPEAESYPILEAEAWENKEKAGTN